MMYEVKAGYLLATKERRCYSVLLVEAETFGEAEARAVSYISRKDAYDVEAVTMKRSRIRELVNEPKGNGTDVRSWVVRLSYPLEDVRRVTYDVLAFSESIPESGGELMRDYLAGVDPNGNMFQVEAVLSSSICDYLPISEDRS